MKCIVYSYGPNPKGKSISFLIPVAGWGRTRIRTQAQRIVAIAILTEPVLDNDKCGGEHDGCNMPETFQDTIDNSKSATLQYVIQARSYTNIVAPSFSGGHVSIHAPAGGATVGRLTPGPPITNTVRSANLQVSIPKKQPTNTAGPKRNERQHLTPSRSYCGHRGRQWFALALSHNQWSFRIISLLRANMLNSPPPVLSKEIES